MKYMILIYMSDAIERAIIADGVLDELDATHGTVIGELTASGELIGSHELAVPDAKVVRTAGGLSVTDGPYAETTEWVGGYYLIDARDEDRAVAIAARFVEARYGTVEVRRIVA
ncbi:YciI family protein [Planctomonas psychrotolerans]|uniref:YciI family protein n=1 Tax=Planctomonas psychrotolerans TaxID=2528712 RepID=UPI00123B057E|nr:YciI family protein [Planctomonas psychrotolerans]